MKIKKQSAGVVVTRRFDDGMRYLLLRCYGYWDFPKGKLDPGEDPLEAARREVTEETGLTSLQFRWGEDYTETPPYGRGKVARYYLAETATDEIRLPISPELGAPEHHEFRWVSYAKARALLNERVGSVLAWAQQQMAPLGRR